MGRLLPAFLSSLFEEHGVHPSDVSIVVDNPQSSILLSSEEGGQSESSLRISLDDSVVIAATSHHSADDASLSLSPTGMLLRRRPFSLVLAPSPSTKASTKEQRRWDSMSSSDSCLFAPPRRKSSLNSVSTSGGGAGGRRHYLQYSSDEDQQDDGYESDDGVRTSEQQQHQLPSYSRSFPLDVPASAAASSTTRSHPTRRNSRYLTQPRQLTQPLSKPAPPSTTFQRRGRMVKSRSAPLSAYASAASSSVTSPRPPRRLRSIDFAEAEPPLGEPRMDPSPPPSPPPTPPPPPPTLPTRMTMVKTKHPPSNGGGDRRIVTHGRPHHAWQRPSPPSIAGGRHPRPYEPDGNNKDDSTSTSATALSSSSSSSLRHGEDSPSPPRRVRSALLTTTTTAMGDRTNAVVAASAATTTSAAGAAMGPPKRRDSFLARMRMFHPSNALPQTLPGAAAPAAAVAKVPDE